VGAPPSGGARAPADGGSAEPGAGIGPPPLPTISFPKGGGAIRGIGEKFSVNPATGTASLSIPLPVSTTRAELAPKLSLTYDSGGGNGPFGIGWNVGTAAITRKTELGLPLYADGEESDVFLISDAEDLVPVLTETSPGTFTRATRTQTLDGKTYRVDRYRPRTDALHALIERWTNEADGEVHWRFISPDNTTTLFGTSASSRLVDPADELRVFSWLASESYDDRGNALLYTYKAEDSTGVDVDAVHERNRTASTRKTQRYLKSVRYGNRTPHTPGESLASRTDWLFELIFDYGEHYAEDGSGTPTLVTTKHDDPNRPWLVRADPFSSYRSTFELRTYRLCRNVLLFHHFPDELDTADCLVRAAHLEYDETPAASALTSITHSGYTRRADGTYLKRSFPPTELKYEQPTLHTEVREVDRESLANLPGADVHEWVDLAGDGVAGVLLDTGAGGWLYKRNLSPVADGGVELAAARSVGAAQLAGQVPGARRRWIDLAGDGQPDLLELGGPLAGFHARNTDGGWRAFTSFTTSPKLDFDGNRNLQLVDVTGDGMPDILITQDDAVRWHPSLREQGFGAEESAVPAMFDEEGAPRVLLGDPSQTIQLADLSGDGMPDLVRIRNGEVAYWPNLGYGRFGAKVTLSNSAWFDTPERFDAARIRLGDVDGSGPADIVYLGDDGVYLYVNESGNALAAPQHIGAYPLAGTTQMQDILGNGTSCLVWSAPLPAEEGRQLRYVDLMGGVKPHLLTGYANNLGADTTIAYATSTKFAIADDLAGRPWVTRLPFPVQVVERVETRDRIGRTRFVTRYAYHHGYYDGTEREFRGFGMVEHWDTEEHRDEAVPPPDGPAHNWDAASWVPPMKTCTWFHTGAFIEAPTVSKQYAHEYWTEPALRSDAHTEDREAMLLPDTVLPPGLSPGETREAFRALRGRALRTEVYAEDGTPRAEHPYSVTEQSYTVRRLQPQHPNRHAVLTVDPREAIEFHYERHPGDPRVTHELTLETDEFGNVLRSVSVAYGRRAGSPAPEPTLTPSIFKTMLAHDQARTHVSAVQSIFTAVLDDPATAPDVHRAPQPAESIGAELIGLVPAANRAGITNLFTFDELDEHFTVLATGASDVPYEELTTSDVNGGGAPPAGPSRRIIEHSRVLYRREDLTGLLPLGTTGPRALPGEIYHLALTQSHVDRVLGSARAPDATLTEGGFVKIDGDWWRRSGLVFYTADETATPAQELAEAQAHFYLPRRATDPFDATRTIDYDAYDLLPETTKDAVGNETRAENDYRMLKAVRTTDPNGNRSEFAFDALGFVVGTALMGKGTETVGDSLAGFTADLDDITARAHIASPLTSPEDVLGDATSRLIYDLHAFFDTKDNPEPQAPLVYTLSRETHASDLMPDDPPPYQHVFSYSDGFAHEVQRKALAPPDPTPRWIGSAWTIFDNKGNSLRTYEPFFSSMHHFEFAATVGVATTLLYDPSGRLVATLHPDGSWSKDVFDPWSKESWDSVDTSAIADPRADADVGDHMKRVLGPGAFTSWHDARIGGTLGATATQRAANKDAAEKSAANAATPTVAHFDARGRAVLTVADNGPAGRLGDRLAYDASGRPVALTDPLGRRAEEWCFREPQGGGAFLYVSGYGVGGDQIYTSTLDGGARRMLANAAAKPYRTWDARGHAFRVRFDDEQRVTHRYVKPDDGPEILLERSIYGEGQPADRNLAGRLYRHYDSGGLRAYERYDFKGNAVETAREIAREYRSSTDWSPIESATTVAALDTAAAPLLGERFMSSTIYDARNREIQTVTPHNGAMKPNVIRTGFDESGCVKRIDVWNQRSSAPAGLLDPATADLHALVDARYNARLQRISATYGNAVVCTREYDALTFRVARILTTRPGTFPANERVVQDLSYTYDAVGNVTRIRDDADIQNVVFFQNQRVDPTADYTYDPLYRLVRATGREHLGQNPVPQQTTDNDLAHAGVLHPGDGLAMAAYTETYAHDAAANHLSIAHQAGSGGWTRRYAYAAPSRIDSTEAGNRVSATSLPSDPVNGPYSATYEYDDHGNTTRMPHLPAMTWDELDRLRSTTRQIVNSGTPETAFNVYGSDGIRVRHVVDRQATSIETATPRSARVYLGAVEVYRELGTDGETVVLERETLHVPGLPERTAIVETRTHGTDEAPDRATRYQHTNQLGSAQLELDAGAAVVSYEEYLPYGSTAYQAVRSQTDVPKRYRYTGKERDVASGLYYHGARYYAPWLGRWLSCDPSGAKQGPNAYVYCGLRPSTLMDPDGKDPATVPVTSPGPVNVPPGGPVPYAPPNGPPVDSSPPGGNLWQGPPKTPAPRVAPRVGPRVKPGTGGGILVFLQIMLTDSNADTVYTVKYTDPDSGQELTFRSVDELEGYKNRKAYEKLHAPPPKNLPPKVEAPPEKTDLDEIKDIIDPNKGPVEAPGPKSPSDTVEAPGTEPEPMPLEARPLSKTERSIIDKQLKSGKKLTTDMKTLLRWEARWKWEQSTGKAAPKGSEVHHIIPLEFAHLFPNMDPNDPTNLVLMKTADHQILHWMMNKWIREQREKAKKAGKDPDKAITPKQLEDMKKAFLELWKGRYKAIK
jgi:RHS repeat-associated protein